MSNSNDNKSGKRSTRDWVSAKIRKHLPIPNSSRRSKSLSPGPSSSSERKTPPTPCTQASAANTPPTARPSAPSHTFASSTAANPTGAAPATPPMRSATTGQPAAILATLAQTPTATALPQTLSPLEIRQRTADLLKIRLTSEEAKKIKWDETTEEQAKAVVEGVQRSLKGKPDHTGKMYKTLQYINQYSKIIDMAIQHQPCITALVWAGMRTVIQVRSLLMCEFPPICLQIDVSSWVWRAASFTWG